MMTTCKKCKKKTRQFCRRWNIAMNSNICELAQHGKFGKAIKSMRGI